VGSKLDLSGLTGTITDIDLLHQTIPSKVENLIQQITDGYDEISEKAFPAIDNILTYAISVTDGGGKDFKELTTFAERLSLRLNEWTHYLALGGTVMIAIFAIIVGLFIVGMVLGIVGAYYRASHGSSALTGAVALGYIFSWIFLLVALGVFTIGAHLERYVCQGLTPNQNGSYSAIQVKYNVNDIFYIYCSLLSELSTLKIQNY